MGNNSGTYINYEAVNKILNDREYRVEYQKKLMGNYAENNYTLVTIRINYPGIEKSNVLTDFMVNTILEDIETYNFKHIIYNEKYKNGEGLIGHFIIDEDSLKVKKNMIEVEENHILGRCVDIDVYGNDNGKLYGVSRSDLGLQPRKCFICQEEARICSRMQKHSLKDINDFFINRYEKYILYRNEKNKLSYEISQLSLKAMIEEVSTMPSFGLVSPCTNGSHKDMNFYTFLNSSFAIAPFIKEMVEVGYSYSKISDIFSVIRRLGIDCEKKMFQVTNGINTHKGMIFLIGIVSASIGKALYEGLQFKDIKSIIREMCKDIVEDFYNLDKKIKLSHGENLYLKYGFTGIRGEVFNGLEIIFDYALPIYESLSLKENELYAHTLLVIMSELNDSTIVHRHGINELNEVKEKSKKILSLGGFNSCSGKELALQFEKECIEMNISPGGSADLLAVTIFLDEVQNKYFRIQP